MCVVTVGTGIFFANADPTTSQIPDPVLEPGKLFFTKYVCELILLHHKEGILHIIFKVFTVYFPDPWCVYSPVIHLQTIL